ncbi:NTPase [Pseudomonas sp. BCA14]|uniref:KAP family P-loop NTPase fold protein n=1 Tax=unclassified Pseudomonas TaxID=196821 RepID=UPI00106E36CD|nr:MULTISPECIES: P-loop NTPase fold protein [unclassified Pseudomonas]TFF14269.1 NTPase [Pseudomonas sp. JMN1]TFF15047.1 NTPase [Pseudomonas sp. BCA17]TFF31453.1 NTPase [Pseudomonas sp. BCA14]TFF32407.1 NTPase [Pseudomonas sp. BCA13]
MKLKNAILDIPQDNIFQNDKLNRRDSVVNLTRLLENVSSPIVLSVNAPWGAGKTTYLKMLHANLNASSCKSVYFSAWETDFAVDPLLAFLGEMNSGLSGFLKGDSKKSKAWAKAKEAGAHILRRGIPVGVKIATAGLLDADKLLEDEAAKFTEALSKDVIGAYSNNKKAIAEFKKNVAEVLKGGDGEAEKLYVFVDELDRCRPTYAIELLERIKHLLDIEGLVFVLALDKVQLAHSVRAVYGAEFDALGYLKRFIDVEFTLPSVGVNFFIKHLFAHLELDNYFATRNTGDTVYDKEHLLNTLNMVGRQMSLRGVEQLLSKIKLISLTVPSNQYFYPEFVVFLLYVKDNYSTVYANFSKLGVGGDEILAVLEVVLSGEDDQAIWTRQYVEALIISGKSRSAKAWADSKIANLKEVAGHMEVPDIKVRHATRVLELVQHHGRYGNSVSLENILNRIDMLSNFVFD